MVSLSTRLRNKVAGVRSLGDHKELGDKVMSVWLGLSGLGASNQTGGDLRAEWMRLRIEASELNKRRTGKRKDPDAD